MDASGYAYKAVVFNPGSRTEFWLHQSATPIEHGSLLDPAWWGGLAPPGKRLLRVLRIVPEADWPVDIVPADQTHDVTVLETEWA